MPELIEMRLNTVNRDIPPAETKPSEWTATNNVQFRNGFAIRSNGWSELFPPVPSPPQWSINITRAGINYWIVGCETGIFRTDTAVWLDITPTVFNASIETNQWTGGILNGIVVMNLANSQNVPWYLDWTTNQMLPLPGWPSGVTCGALRTHKFHLFAMNILDNGADFSDQILWSDSAAPGNVPATWLASPSNDAGSTILADTPNPVIDGGTLRASFVIYKRNATYVANFVGGTFVFAFRLLFATSGILARNCVDEYEGKAYVITDGDAYVHDGQSLQSLLQGRAKDEIFNQISDTAWPFSYVAIDRANQEVLFCFAPQGADVPAVAVTYTVNTDSIGARQIGSANHITSGIVTETGSSEAWEDDLETWAQDTTIWNQTFFNASQDGMVVSDASAAQLFFLDGAIDQNGAPISCIIRKDDYDFGKPEIYKLVSRIWPRVTASSDVLLRVRVAGARTANDAPIWSPAVDFRPDEDEYVDTFSNGRFLSFEFSSEGGQPFQLDGFDVELQLGGKFG